MFDPRRPRVPASLVTSLVPRLAALLSLALPSAALADGYETPNLHSARSVGMGSTGIGWLEGPLALPENPAGISGTRFITVAANLSLLLAQIDGSPAYDEQNAESDVTPAPLPALAASFRVTDWLTLAFGTYPVALAGADYGYTARGSGAQVDNALSLLFWEFAPAVSFDVPGGVRIGAAYRVTLTSLTQTETAATTVNDFGAIGVNWTGFRVGVQYSPIPEIELGAMYRHRVDIETHDDEAKLLGIIEGELDAEFTLPTMFGFGVRGNLGPFSLASDVQYGLHSEAERSDLKITREGAEPFEIPNIQKWDDGFTVKAGAEYRLLDGALALRTGYYWDQNTTQAAYPSPWGTPPGDTHSVSLGAGYDGGAWAVDLAWSNRFGSGTSTAEDKAGAEPCRACGYTGEYAVHINGIYLDFEWAFGTE